MASASTPGGGDSGGLLNISHNQVPIEVCNDTIPINVIGAQVPVDGLAAALGLLSPGNTVAKSDTSCHENTGQVNGHTMAARWGCTTCGAPAVLDDDPGGDSGGLANVSHNQVPIEACDITVPINGIGLQVPLDHIAGGLGILSPGDTVADQDSSCNSDTGQANG